MTGNTFARIRKGLRPDDDEAHRSLSAVESLYRLARQKTIDAVGDRTGLVPEIEAIIGRAEYLQHEINEMRRAMQDAGTWDQFCADYASYKERRRAVEY